MTKMEFHHRAADYACLVMFILLAVALGPRVGSAQTEVSAGLLFGGDGGLEGGQVGPLLSAGVSRDVLGLPLFFEAGIGRTDFTSLGQDYHHNHYLLALGAEWFLTGGETRLGVRLGLGAYGELETVETEPASDGGGGWVETVIPGLVLEREIGSGRRLVVRLSDAVLGPWFAVLDPSEYDIEHRLLLVLGVRF